MMKFVSTDFIMDRTPKGFLWQREDMANIPRIRMPCGSICEPLLRYFAYGWLVKLFKSKNSMEPDAYSLREWFCYLANLGLDWRKGSDGLMRSFRLSFAKKIKEGAISAAQVELKMEHIFKFYRTISKAMPFVGRGQRTPVFVGAPGVVDAPITSSLVGKDKALKWIGWKKIQRATARRPTPDFDDIDRIKEHLRSNAMQQPDGSWEQALQIFAAERNWLIVRCEVEAGLRRAETANLSLARFAEALSSLKIVEMPRGRWRSRNSSNPLSDACHDEVLRSEIVGGIEKLKARGYETLNVVVAAKGGGDRAVEFPLDLVLDLLEIGIWNIRKRLFEHWEAQGKTHLDHDAIFISSTRDGARLAVKSVGDIVNDAFSKLGVEGSGHRLRAYYLTDMAWLLWNQALAIAGYRNDVAVTNHVLHRLADLAGHRQPGTLERHYLDMAKGRHRMKTNRPRLDAAKNAMNAHISASPRFSKEKNEILERVILAFDDCDDPRLYAVIGAAIDKYAIPRQRSAEKKSSHLHIVANSST